MKILLLLPLLLGFSVPAIAHNEFNGGDAMHNGIIFSNGNGGGVGAQEGEEGEGEGAESKRKPVWSR
tara:strand:+ start:3789 stop:3989 length:201 start_codon:yes stop_codon:yes gene_type:complete